MALREAFVASNALFRRLRAAGFRDELRPHHP
jgi:hypothetical protein